MGIVLPLKDSVLEKIAPEERATLGRAGVTTREAIARRTLKDERADHAQFINYLNLRAIRYEHEDPTKRATGQRGWPDFRCFYPPRKVLFIEFKRHPNKLTAEQREVRESLESCGFPYVVAYSLSEAIEATQRWLLQ